MDLIVPLLEVVEMHFDFFFEAAKIEEILVVVHSQLVLCIHARQQNSKFPLHFRIFQLGVPNYHIKNAQFILF